MISKTRFSPTLATLAAASLLLAGCSSAPKDTTVDAKEEKTEQVAAQSKAEACALVKESMEKMSSEVNASPGEAGETGSLEDQRRVAEALLSDTAKVTNSEVSKSFSGFAEALAAMVKFNEEQADASADTDVAPETVSDAQKELVSKFFEATETLGTLCG